MNAMWNSNLGQSKERCSENEIFDEDDRDETKSVKKKIIKYEIESRWDPIKKIVKHYIVE